MGHWLGEVRLSLEESGRISLARKALRWEEDLVGGEILKEGQQGAWAGRGDFPRAYWKDSTESGVSL